MFEKVLVPLDGSERAEAIIPWVQDLAEKHGSEVTLLRVIDPMPTVTDMSAMGGPMAVQMAQDYVREEQAASEKYLDQLGQRFRDIGQTVHHKIAYGAVAETILEVANEDNVDLIAIASHGRSGFGNMFFGSVALSVLHRSDKPLLLIRAPGD